MSPGIKIFASLNYIGQFMSLPPLGVYIFFFKYYVGGGGDWLLGKRMKTEGVGKKMKKKGKRKKEKTA